ncbi:alpha/beta hydrolase [Pseudonocardia alni]|uniref:alpha/beta hydrolase n=1 Tax=Pseudonocardia alni TaxID=33907 RepID=UPI0033278D86
MTEPSTVALTAPNHCFVEHYPGLVYKQFDEGLLMPGGRTLHFDLLKPVSPAPTPLVVFVKGGGFRNVHRARYLPALVPFAQTGVTVASVEYRTSNEVRFSSAVDDVRDAIRYLRRHAAALGIDPAAVAIWGNSAGASIASTVGAAPADAEDGVCAVASWYGVHDPAAVSAYQEADSPIRSALGPPGPGPDRWFCPSDHVTADSAPSILVHGTDDTVVDVSQSLALATELDRHGVPHEVVLVKGGVHSFAQMCTRSDALPRTFAFLGAHLRRAALRAEHPPSDAVGTAAPVTGRGCGHPATA